MNGIELGDLPPSPDPGLLAAVRAAEPATIGHFHDRGFLQARIRALTAAPRTLGTAVTVRCDGADGSVLHHALGQLRPGDFLVVERTDDDDGVACLGGASALAAQLRGAVGVVIDGCATDIDELRQIGLPVWARGLSARTTRSLGRSGSFCRPVNCGGVVVNPGDLVLADENGVLVMSPQEATGLARRACELQHAEKTTLARLRAGETYPHILGTVLHGARPRA